ncbi:GDCCVxC domain-containing (seleno)protein [Thalassotalea ganghwensis]
MLNLYSVITCPQCGAKQKEMMPTNACQYYYQCTSCQQLLKPLAGDCCVFCSDGSVKCPPIQQGNDCCNS